MMAPSLIRTLWLPILLILQASLLPFTRAEEGIITLSINEAWSYRAELTDFGYALNQSLRYKANFMTPPLNDTQLCSFPSLTLSDLNRAARLSKPVALLVSLGGCDTDKKISIALEIHEKVTNYLRFIVFYNNDPNNPDEILKVAPIVDKTFTEDLQEMSFSAVSTATSSAVLANMQQFSAISGSTSDLLGASSEGWMLEMVIETAANPYISLRMNNHQRQSSNFYWFRIVLFALLVLSPFCRAIFLWWTGGGRIRFRRNETGRFIGFLYTPPMAYWFVSHGTQEAEPVADTMTNEQVLALAEIIYKPPYSEQRTMARTAEISSDSDDADESKRTSEEEDDDRLIKIVDRASAIMNISSSPAEDLTGDDNYDTICGTTCPICIEDFESGEKLRMLPCGHAFHTECILPWLTRRQGCCPLCKKSVLGGAEDEETNTAAESAPYSRCLDTNSGVENVSGTEDIEESAATPLEQTISAGDTELPNANTELSTTTNEPARSDAVGMMAPGEGIDRTLVVAVSDAKAPTEVASEADLEAGITGEAQTRLEVDVKTTSELAEFQNPEAEKEQIKSRSDHETPNDGAVTPTRSESSSNEDAQASNVAQNVSTLDVDVLTTVLDEKVDSTTQTTSVSEQTTSDFVGEGDSDAVEASDGMTSTAVASSEYLRPIDNIRESGSPESSVFQAAEPAEYAPQNAPKVQAMFDEEEEPAQQSSEEVSTTIEDSIAQQIETPMNDQETPQSPIDDEETDLRSQHPEDQSASDSMENEAAADESSDEELETPGLQFIDVADDSPKDLV